MARYRAECCRGVLSGCYDLQATSFLDLVRSLGERPPSPPLFPASKQSLLIEKDDRTAPACKCLKWHSNIDLLKPDPKP